MKEGKDPKIGWALLLIAFLIGCVTIYWGEFVDEADNLAIGAQVAQGATLYRDIFTHHFPLPYFWIAGLVSVFGKSLLVMRLSLWLFQIVSFGLGMRLTGFYTPIGLTALLWSILRRFYDGNLFLYSAISAAALLVVGVLTFALLQSDRPGRKGLYWAIGVYSAIALLSDPLTIYALLVAYLFLLWLNWRQALSAGAAALAVGSLFGLYLLFSNSWNDFYQAVFVFNLEIYGRYLNTNPLRVLDWIKLVLSGLDITNSHWYHLHPLRPLSLGSSFDRWFFTGFLYRFSLLAAALLLLMKQRYRLAFFLYAYAAAVMLINAQDFRSQPFALFALLAGAALASQLRWLKRPLALRGALQFSFSFMIALMLAWLLVRSSIYSYEHKSWFKPQNQFRSFQVEIQRLNELACGQTDVHLAHYPGGAYYYWFTDFKPVARYVYMWPWIADIGLSEVVAELDSQQIKAIVVIQDQNIWGHFPTWEYLKPLDMLLASDYIQVGERTYLSPALAAACRP